MKVMLGTAPLNRKEHVNNGETVLLRPPTGITYLGSMLGKQPAFGFGKIADVMLEEVNRDLGKVREDIRKFAPDVFGFTCFEFNLGAAGELCSLVREASPKTLVFVGGPTATLVPSFVLKETGADAAFRGEADLTFRQAIQHLERGGKLEGIDLAGVLVRDGKKILETASSRIIPTIPLAQYRMIEPEIELLNEMVKASGYWAMDFSFSRGCPYQRCSFCQISPVMGHKRLTLEKTIGILKQIAQIPGIALMTFGDGTFGGSKQGAKALLSAIEKENIRFEKGYFAELSTEQVLTQGAIGDRRADMDFLGMMTAVGMKGCEMGIEHFSKNQLKKFGKARHTFGEIRDVLLKMKGMGIHSSNGIFLYGADSRCEDVIESIERGFSLAYDLHPAPFGFTDFPTPYIGTDDYEAYLKLMDRCQIANEPVSSTKGILLDYKNIRETGEKEYPYMVSYVLPLEDRLLQWAVVRWGKINQGVQEPAIQRLFPPGDLFMDLQNPEIRNIALLVAIRKTAMIEGSPRGEKIVRQVDNAFKAMGRDRRVGFAMEIISAYAEHF